MRSKRSLTPRKAQSLALFGAAAAALLLAAPAQAATATLVKDIRPGGGGSGPNALKNVGGTIFFAAGDGRHGRELWKSNGTAAGTKLVKDINPGSKGSNPSNLTNVGGKLLFTARTPARGTELWKSDGTAAGTTLVKDINPGAASSLGDEFAMSTNGTPLTNVAGTLFFAADEPIHGGEVWKSNGTASGTKLVKDVAPGQTSSDPTYLCSAGGRLFFGAFNSGSGSFDLWKSNGTAAGTQLVKERMTPGSCADLGGIAYFATYHDGAAGLWRSDGTEGGTQLVESSPSGPYSLRNIGGTLYFAANGLWRSDGTEQGTEPVKDVGLQYPDARLTKAGSRFFFPGYVFTSGSELWRSDGNSSGTQLVKDINPGHDDGVSTESLFGAVGDTVFFGGITPTRGLELWKSDGTAAGTKLVKDINFGAASSVPGSRCPLGQGTGVTGYCGATAQGKLFFAATEPQHGRELWKAVP